MTKLPMPSKPPFFLERLTDYSDEALLDEVRRVASELDGQSLTKAAFAELGRVGLTTLRRRIGSWRVVLERAGLLHLYGGQPISEKMTSQSSRLMTDNEILNEIRRISKLNNGNMTVDLLNKNSTISAAVVRSRFRTWGEALRRAGIDVSVRGRRHNDEECFENMLRVWTHLGRQPKYKEMAFSPSTVGGKAYVLRYGSWMRALHAFVQRVKEDQTPDQLPTNSHFLVYAPVTESKRTKAEDKRQPSIGLRFNVLRRDNFRCVLCGISPAIQIGCTLHVDHIVPFSKGGKTTSDNLRTLCSICNVGRSDRFDD